MKFTDTQKEILNSMLEKSKALNSNEQKFVVQTNIFKCYQNGHQWFNNFHSFWTATKEDALATAKVLNDMGVHTKVKTHLGYDVK